MSICPMCNQPSEQINVHGHLQCSVCGNNIGPCCQGETCEPYFDMVNEGHYIELIDRVHVIASNIEEHLINHRLTADVKQLTEYFESAQESLLNAYQLIGNIMPNDKDKVY